MYCRKISGPLLDRIDLHIKISAVSQEKLLSKERRESSSDVLQRVIRARQIQARRFRSQLVLNKDMNHSDIKRYCHLDTKTRAVLLLASRKLGLSARSFYKMIKIGRTIADLDSRANIVEGDIMEALQFRSHEY